MSFFASSRQRSGQLATVVIIMIVFIAGFAFGNQFATVSAAQNPLTPPADSQELFAPFWQVYNLILNDYVDPQGQALDRAKLVDGAISGMVNSLGDQFSAYMDPKSFPEINQELEGQFEGIGVVIRTDDATKAIEVVSVLEGSPAQSVGIHQGDIFLKVGDVDVSTMTQTDLANYVRGKEGTSVKITMLRDGQPIEFDVTRAKITVPNIEQKKLDDHIGYIKLNQFSADARGDIDKALATLDPKSLNGLILDLRGNPGGLLNTAIDVGSAFLKDKTILIEDFGKGNTQTYQSNGNYAGIDVPMVVMVDEGSASAAELIAGALQDNQRATVVGETSFGKGTVQTWQQLINGGGVRLTIARWLTPDKHWIHHQGITPDIVVPWDQSKEPLGSTADPQLDAAVRFLEAAIPAPN